MRSDLHHLIIVFSASSFSFKGSTIESTLTNSLLVRSAFVFSIACGRLQPWVKNKATFMPDRSFCLMYVRIAGVGEKDQTGCPIITRP